MLPFGKCPTLCLALCVLFTSKAQLVSSGRNEIKNADYSTVAEEVEEMKHQIKSLATSHKALTKRHATILKNEHSLQTSYDEIAAGFKGILASQQQLASSQKKLMETVEKMASENKDLEENKQQLSTAQKKLTDALEKQSSENKGLSERLEQLSSAQKKLVESVEKMASEITQLSSSQKDVVRNQQKTETNVAEMQTTCKQLDKKVDNCTSRCVTSRDCSDVIKTGQRTSGVYTVVPTGQPRMDVYCDMNTDNGGWLVIQRRKDGSVNFERTWTDYADGFGSLNGEFWIGNNKLNQLTASRNYKLRVDMEDFDGQTRYAVYQTFKVDTAANKYRLTVSGYSGNAGDSLSGHNGFYFSTADQDNDVYGGNCAKQFRGAWWYGACHSSNLNGAYLRAVHASYADGIEWHSWRGHNYSLKVSEIKIKPVEE